MGLKRRGVISILLLITTLCIGNLMFIATAPAHEFGHYITAKFFGWNVTEVDWYSHIKCSEETMDNASRMEKIMVSTAGPILAPIISYILVVLILRRSTIRDILALPYLGFGIFGSCSDLKKVVWHLLVSAPMPRTEHQILSPTNLVVSILTMAVVLGALNVIVVDRYKRCVVELATVIDELDDHDEETQDNEE